MTLIMLDIKIWTVTWYLPRLHDDVIVYVVFTAPTTQMQIDTSTWHLLCL